MSVPKSNRYLVLEVPEEQMLGYLAQEGGLTDVALDALQAQLAEPELDPGEAAAIALTVARAARPSSMAVLTELRARLETAGRVDEALAIRLAQELLPLRPSDAVERADKGYRIVFEDVELFVEDPVAGNWHRSNRWGPPLRPDVERAPVLARGAGNADAYYQAAADGQIVVLTFTPGRFFGRAQPALRLTRAGFARAADLSDLVRWSQVESLGMLTRNNNERVAFTQTGQPPQGLPERASIPTAELLGLMERLLKRARP